MVSRSLFRHMEETQFAVAATSSLLPTCRDHSSQYANAVATDMVQIAESIATRCMSPIFVDSCWTGHASGQGVDDCASKCGNRSACENSHHQIQGHYEHQSGKCSRHLRSTASHWEHGRWAKWSRLRQKVQRCLQLQAQSVLAKRWRCIHSVSQTCWSWLPAKLPSWERQQESRWSGIWACQPVEAMKEDVREWILRRNDFVSSWRRLEKCYRHTSDNVFLNVRPTVGQQAQRQYCEYVQRAERTYDEIASSTRAKDVGDSESNELLRVIDRVSVLKSLICEPMATDSWKPRSRSLNKLRPLKVSLRSWLSLWSRSLQHKGQRCWWLPWQWVLLRCPRCIPRATSSWELLMICCRTKAAARVMKGKGRE